MPILELGTDHVQMSVKNGENPCLTHVRLAFNPFLHTRVPDTQVSGTRSATI